MMPFFVALGVFFLLVFGALEIGRRAAKPNSSTMQYLNNHYKFLVMLYDRNRVFFDEDYYGMDAWEKNRFKGWLDAQQLTEILSYCKKLDFATH